MKEEIEQMYDDYNVQLGISLDLFKRIIKKAKEEERERIINKFLTINKNKLFMERNLIIEKVILELKDEI